METAILTELAALSMVTVALAVLLGFLDNGGLGAFMLGGAASVASLVCLGGLVWRGWAGLLIGVLFAALSGYVFSSRFFGKRRSGLFVALLWLGYCAACAVGYWAAGWLGWLTITLPSLMLFWYSLWRFSGRLLPQQIRRQRWWLLRDLLRCLFGPHQLDDEEQGERLYRYQSLRALLTYSLGTNYPYYVVEGRELEERVDGNPFRQFFAGPGIVITGPHHAVVITNGMREVNEIGAPGLTFTGPFERVDQIVDLRPQLKAFDVEALTEDGIRIRVLTFVFFRIHSDEQQPGKFWAGKGSETAIFQALCRRPVEHLERHNWDELVPMVATRALQDIISRYKFDDLCARDQPDRAPREEIKQELITRLEQAASENLQGIQILGGGIANLEPVDSSVMRRRIENWRTEWTRKMMAQMGEGATEAMRLISQARAQGQAEVIRILSKEAGYTDSVDKAVLVDVVVLRLLEAMEDLACRPAVQQLLPPEATETMKYLRRAIGEGNSTKVQESGG